MRNISPQINAPLFQPGVQRRQIRKVRHRLPLAMSGIPNVFLDLPRSPLGLNQWRLDGSTQPDAGFQNCGSKT